MTKQERYEYWKISSINMLQDIVQSYQTTTSGKNDKTISVISLVHDLLELSLDTFEILGKDVYDYFSKKFCLSVKDTMELPILNTSVSEEDLGKLVKHLITIYQPVFRYRYIEQLPLI